jgi:hypothetical protein
MSSSEVGGVDRDLDFAETKESCPEVERAVDDEPFGSSSSESESRTTHILGRRERCGDESEKKE